MEYTVRWMDSAGSTNLLVRNNVLLGTRLNEIIVAGRQTEGRGRLGRTFFSPEGGTYFSFALPYGEDDPTLTSSVAVAVCRALRRHGTEALIKWVNDIYVGGRKAGGILCERAESPLDGSYAVIGVGLNTGGADFPGELSGTACSVSVDASPRELAAEIVGELLEIRKTGLDVGEYTGLSMLIGREIRWNDGGTERTGRAAGIDEKCGLVVESGGEVAVLRSGTVDTVRPTGGVKRKC